MSILIAHLTENVTDHSEVPRRAGDKHDLCGQEFGTTVMWHFCLDSDGKTLHNAQMLLTLTDDIGASEAEELRCFSRGECMPSGRFA